MAISHEFKRLWWWGADVGTNNDMTGVVTPIVASFLVTWGDLSTYTWGQLSANTWGQPLSTSSSVTTTATSNTGTQRRFVKFAKGLRYRQIKFKVKLFTRGYTTDGPAKVFTMTAITEAKAIVPKSVN